MTACVSKIGNPRHLAWEKPTAGAAGFVLAIVVMGRGGSTTSRADEAQLSSYSSSPFQASLPSWAFHFVGLAVVAVSATLGVVIRQFRQRQGG